MRPRTELGLSAGLLLGLGLIVVAVGSRPDRKSNERSSTYLTGPGGASGSGKSTLFGVISGSEFTPVNARWAQGSDVFGAW